ncbi:MAG TPA: antibiotic biosynthesis monooxygenase [Aromatoleum sp.]|uniref:antibiotic biosynthesis monooxygenase n=1 Tax=Aromatoleum sp. TaxID=2307007 RepID=UPI002B476E2F|nr:antibiotic biosynthesis monooxygenase [Aromatoleum sp.]HJV24583.1 antibiotic biosynthesis monooxygenase [Aromatoleum sp.]
MSIHVAITRRVRAGCEADFQQALREFFQTSFGHRGVMGASLLVPPPGSDAREYGILRTFRNEEERDAFYDSPMFKEWDERAKTMTEGEPEYRRLDGLEAWFRSPGPPPPRWKMALLTWIAVWPVSMIVAALFAPLLGQLLPKFLFAGVVAGGIVIVLTWGAMPLLVRIARPWLHGAKTSTNIPEKR